MAAWLANLGRYANGGSDRAHWLEAWSAAGVTVNRRSRTQPLHLPKFPVSIVGTIQPDRIADVFNGSDDGMPARFLYAWPEGPGYTSLMDRRIPRDADALSMLQYVARCTGSVTAPTGWRPAGSARARARWRVSRRSSRCSTSRPPAAAARRRTASRTTR